MAADDLMDGSDGEKYVDLKTPPSEDAEDHGDAETATAPAPAEEPAEDAKKLKCSVIFLCFYGFMSSIRPGEAFITPNLLSSEKNFTEVQVSYFPLCVNFLGQLSLLQLKEKQGFPSPFNSNTVVL